METLIAVTKTYETGKPDSLVVIIPSEVRKLLSIEKGERFAVKIDERGRVIYERIGFQVQRVESDKVEEGKPRLAPPSSPPAT